MTASEWTFSGGLDSDDGATEGRFESAGFDDIVVVGLQICSDGEVARGKIHYSRSEPG